MAYTKEERREYMNRWRHRRRQEALARLGGKCSKCGSEENLEFDHIDPATKVSRIAKIWTSSKEKFDLELSKCQLLCRACHLEKCFEEGSIPRYHQRGCNRAKKCKCKGRYANGNAGWL